MKALALGMGLLLLFAGFAAAAAAEGPPLAVVVHPSRQVELDLADLQLIYMKKRRFWPDGSPIVALNLDPDRPERRRFTEAVFGALSDYLSRYWNDEYFHGVLPPITLSSGEAVKRYVRARPNAIGYVALDEVDDTLRVVLTIE